MKRPRPPKKTEILEVRVPHAVKHAFMARARGRGRTASAVVREFIDSYLADATATEAQPMFKRLAKPVAATSIAASALALYAVTPTALAAAPDFRAIFDELDRDRNGVLSVAEFTDRNGDRLRPVDTAFVRVDTRIGNDPKPQLALVRKVGAAELPSGMMTAKVQATLRRPFDAQDVDRSGSVTFDEFKHYHVAVLRQGFDALDTDYSGTIERSEYAAPAGAAVPRASFDQADRDHDGRIGWSEFLG